jgi:thiosulfate/3-mercaptopyruvate sulfurtransferase
VGELPATLPAAGWTIVDCRYELSDPDAGYRRYLEGHIPGAAYAHLHDDLSGPPLTDRGRHPLPSPERMVQVFSALGIGAQTQVVVYDDASGAFAARLWWMLRYMGHDAAAVLDGGWQAWVASGRSREPGRVDPEPARFNGTASRDSLVTLDEVTRVPLLIDSRDAERYSGAVEPVDPVAGHIPGARNYPWKRNIDERGRFLPADKLRAQLEGMLAGLPSEQAVFYCGSGVSACHNVLAAVHAGFDMPRLYVGSWSEWSSDPNRPVSKGADLNANVL